MTRIEQLRAPLLVTWQLTRNCDLACLHCCTESAPGKRLPGELDADEALQLAREIINTEVPYVMLCGGEPLVVPHFLCIAEALGNAGVQLKIETNGQRFDAEMAERLARLPVRSVQISLDADSEEVYRASTTRWIIGQGARGMSRRTGGRIAARSHLCADTDQYRSD